MDKEMPHLNEKQMNTFKISKMATGAYRTIYFYTLLLQIMKPHMDCNDCYWFLIFNIGQSTNTKRTWSWALSRLWTFNIECYHNIQSTKLQTSVTHF